MSSAAAAASTPPPKPTRAASASAATRTPPVHRQLKPLVDNDSKTKSGSPNSKPATSAGTNNNVSIVHDEATKQQQQQQQQEKPGTPSPQRQGQEKQPRPQSRIDSGKKKAPCTGAMPAHVTYSPLFRALPEGVRYFAEHPYSIEELKLIREQEIEKKEAKKLLQPGQKKPVPMLRPGHSVPSPVISDNANRAVALTAFGPCPSELALQVAARRSYLRHKAFVQSFESSERRANVTTQQTVQRSASTSFYTNAARRKKLEAEEEAHRRAIEQFEDQLEQQRDDFSLSELNVRSSIELRERRTRKQLLEASWRGRQTIIFNANVAKICQAETRNRCRVEVDHFLEREALERNCLQRVILNDRVQFLAMERVQRAAIMHLIAAQLAWRIRQEEELTRMISLERRSRQKVEDEEHFDFAPLETAKRALLEERTKQLKKETEMMHAKMMEMEQHNRHCRLDLERAETGARQAMRSEDLDARVQIRAQFVVGGRAVKDIEDRKRALALQAWLETCAKQQRPVIAKEESTRAHITNEMLRIFNDIVGDFHQQWAELLVPVTAQFGPTEISCCRCGPPVNFATDVSFAKKPYLWYRDMYLVGVSIKARFLTNGRGASDLLSLAATQVASVAPKRKKTDTPEAAGRNPMATNVPGLRLLIDGTVLLEDGTTLCTAKFGDDAADGGGGGGESSSSASSTLDFEFQAPADDGVVPLEHIERILKDMTLAPDVQLLSPVPRQLQFTATMWFQRRAPPAGSAPLRGKHFQPGSKEAYSTGCVYNISVIPPLIGCYGRAHTPQVTTLFDVRKRIAAGKGWGLPLLPDPQCLTSLNIDELTNINKLAADGAASEEENNNNNNADASAKPDEGGSSSNLLKKDESKKVPSATASGAASPPAPASPVTASLMRKEKAAAAAAAAAAAKEQANYDRAMLTWALVKIRFVSGDMKGEDAIRWGGNADGFKFRKEDVKLDDVTVAKPVRMPGCLHAYEFGVTVGRSKEPEPFPLSTLSRFLDRFVYQNDNDGGPAKIDTRIIEISISVKRMRMRSEVGLARLTRNLDLVSFINVEIVPTLNGKDDSLIVVDCGRAPPALPSLIRVSREHASSAMRRYLNKVEERSAPLFPSATFDIRPGPNPVAVTVRASIAGGASFSLDLPKPSDSKGKARAQNFRDDDFDFDAGAPAQEGDDDNDLLSAGSNPLSADAKGAAANGKSAASKEKKPKPKPEKTLGTLALGAVPAEMVVPEDATGIFWCGIETDPNIPATRNCVGHICVDSSGKLEAYFKSDTKPAVIQAFVRCLVVNVTETTFVLGASRAGTTSIASIEIRAQEQAPPKKGGGGGGGVTALQLRDPEVALLQRVVLYQAPSISVHAPKGTISFPKETDLPQFLKGIVVLPESALASSACGSKLSGATLSVSIVDGRSGFEQLIIHPNEEADREEVPSTEFVSLVPRAGDIDIRVGFKTVARVLQMETAGKPLMIQMVETDSSTDIAVPLVQSVLRRIAYIHSDADVLYEKVLQLQLTDMSGGACYAACQVQVVPSFEPTVMDNEPQRPSVYRMARFPFYKDSWMPVFQFSDLSDPDTELVGDAFMNIDPVSGTSEDDEVGFAEVPDPEGKHKVTFDRLSVNSPLSILCNGREVAICRTVHNEGSGNGLRVTFRPGIHLEVCGAVVRTLCYRRMDEEVLRTIGDSTEIKSYVFRFNAGDEEGVPDTRVPFQVRLRPPLLWRLLLHDAPLITAPRTVQPFLHVQTGAPASEIIAGDVLALQVIKGRMEGDGFCITDASGVHCVKDPQTGDDVVVVDLDVTRRLMTRVIGATPGFNGIKVATVKWIAASMTDGDDGGGEGGSGNDIKSGTETALFGEASADFGISFASGDHSGTFDGEAEGGPICEQANLGDESKTLLKIEFNAKCSLPASLVSLILGAVGFTIGECTESRKCHLRAIFAHNVKVDKNYTSNESGWLDSHVIVEPNDEATEIHLKHNIVPCFASGSCFPFDGLTLTDPDTEFFGEEGVVNVVSGTSGVYLSVVASASGHFMLEERPVQIPEGKTQAQMRGVSQFLVLISQGKKAAATLRVHDMGKGATKNAVFFDDFQHLPLNLVGKLMECIAVKIAPDVRAAGHLLDVYLAENPKTTPTTTRVQLDVMIPCCTRVDPAPLHWLVSHESTFIFPETINITVPSTSSLDVEFRFLEPETFWTSPLLRDATLSVNPIAPLALAGGTVTVTTPGVSTPTVVCMVDAGSAKQVLRMSFPRSSSRQAAALMEQVLRCVAIQVPEGGTVVPLGALKDHDTSIPGPVELAELKVVVSMTVPTASGPPASLALVKMVKRVVMSSK